MLILFIANPSVLGLSLVEAFTVILFPIIAAYFGWVKYIQVDKEKHQLTLNAETDRQAKKNDAEVERERLKAEAEIEKYKQNSVGAEAVVKIWKEVTSIQEEIKKLSEDTHDGKEESKVRTEIIRRLQEDVSRLMNVLFESLPQRK